MPGGQCGCDPSLPHYHNGTGKCYQLGGIGPCTAGHQFLVPAGGSKAECTCKEGYIKWFGDGACYRPYTRGPCAAGNMYSVNTTATGMAVGCVDVPCTAGKLYFPGGKGCHRVGTQGPCPAGQIVLFQDTVKTSIEGVSYLGMCGCANTDAAAATQQRGGQQLQTSAATGSFYAPSPYSSGGSGDHGPRVLTCKAPVSAARKLVQQQQDGGAGRQASPVPTPSQDPCGHRRGTIAWTDLTCKQLYLQGPCEPGEWVVPDRGKGTRRGRGWKMGKCECRPGFTAVPVPGGVDNATVCQPPSVTLAKFLNMSDDFGNKNRTVMPTMVTSADDDKFNNDADGGKRFSSKYNNGIREPR